MPVNQPMPQLSDDIDTPEAMSILCHLAPELQTYTVLRALTAAVLAGHHRGVRETMKSGLATIRLSSSLQA